MRPDSAVLTALPPQAYAATRHLINDRHGLDRSFPAALRPLAAQPAAYRSALVRHLSAYATKRVRIDSEHGIDGMLITDGGADVWNAEGFSPWQLRAPGDSCDGRLRDRL
jgi:hypothetical protein